MTTKAIDSVKLMRELRDKLGRDMERLTAEERVRFVRERAASTRLGEMLEKRTQESEHG